MSNVSYEVVIVGGSFAGLAAAMQLQGRRVLIVDQHPIGSHQMSACGTPLTTARAVGASASVLAMHHDLVLHTAGKTICFPLQDPFVTFDYRAFCQAMAMQTDAEFCLARVTKIGSHGIETTRGAAVAKFVVDASGGHSPLRRSWSHPRQGLGYGLETELPIQWAKPGLHFFVAKHLIPNGYAWVFPCGDVTRFGVGSFSNGLQLQSVLRRFLDQYGLEAGATHGGVLAIGRRAALHDDVFVVGDAAGQCLPVTGEGIRTALFHGVHCGQALAGALSGRYSRSEAAALYQTQVRGNEQFHHRLHFIQAVVTRMPEPLLAHIARIVAGSGLSDWVMGRYLVQSGWFLGGSVAGLEVQQDNGTGFAEPARA